MIAGAVSHAGYKGVVALVQVNCSLRRKSEPRFQRKNILIQAHHRPAQNRGGFLVPER